MNYQEISIVLKEQQLLERTTIFTESVFQTIQIFIPAGAIFKETVIVKGNFDINIMYKIHLQAKGAVAELKGYLYLQENSKHHWQVQQIHSAPETTSLVSLKAVLADQSFLRYEGTITIEKSASKSVAHQEQKNIVIGKNPQVVSIPNLQVLTHDVQCGHGSAVSHLSDDHLFYLESRGIPFEKAQQMIVDGFLS